MSIIDFGYKNLLRSLLFQFDPEAVHEWTMSRMRLAAPLKNAISGQFRWRDTRLRQEIWGYTFENPLGLAAGFDKNAHNIDLWEMFGFSFVEIGTITPKPQAGNPKPRLFRYPHRKALVNRMGFNNDGAEIIAQRLAQLRPNVKQLVIGVSLGKQFSTPVHELNRVIEDYAYVLERMYPYGDFFVINVSSPNTANLRDLQQADQLSRLLVALRQKIDEIDEGKSRKPLCVKFAPDLEDSAIREATSLAIEQGIDGIIATNTTNQTGEAESGGLSGAPLRMRSTEVIRLIAEETRGTIPIIGCGGIFTPEDAMEKVQAGAWLLQVYTGFVYEGPAITRKILKGFVDFMDQKEIPSIQAIRYMKTL